MAIYIAVALIKTIYLKLNERTNTSIILVSSPVIFLFRSKPGHDRGY